MRLCGDPRQVDPAVAVRLSFLETLCVLDAEPRALGCDRTIVFFNDHDRFDWRRPERLVDVRSGVICCPNNFEYAEPLGDSMVRITALANFDRWRGLSTDDYLVAKHSAHQQMVDSAVRFVGDFRPGIVASDTFTPTTIKRFTGHENGAVYGAPEKRWSGTTHLKNLFVCGTDQGFVGIVGAMVSGILMANRHLLKTRSDE
jgi:phytoene dehydrogenase-like protein